MAVVRHWRALNTNLPYENRDKSSDLRCGFLTANRPWGTQPGYGTLENNWDWYIDRDDIYGMTWTSRMLEEWIDAVGPNVARKYYGPDNWRDYDYYNDKPVTAIQLLGQDYLDGKYNGDITTHDYVTLLNFEADHYGVLWSRLSGVETEDIINTQLSGLRSDPVSGWGVKYRDTICSYRTQSGAWPDRMQRFEIWVVYETAPGSEYFFWILNDAAGPAEDQEMPDYMGATTAAYRPGRVMGFFRMQNLDNDQPTARGNDSGWAMIGQYSSNSILFCVPFNQDVYDKNTYFTTTGPPGPIPGIYQEPFGYDAGQDYRFQEPKLNELIGPGPWSVRSEKDSSAFGTIPAREVRSGTLNPGWGAYGHSLIKNQPIYTGLGQRIGKMPESLLISGQPFASAASRPSSKAFKMIDGVKYLMIPPGLAIKAE